MSPDLLLLAVGAVVAGFVQGLSGFAFSMVAMSFWVWGIEPHVAAIMAIFGGLIGQLVAVFSVPRVLRLKTLLPFLAGGLVGVPLGVALLPLLDVTLFRLVVGLLVSTWCLAMLNTHRLPRITRGGRLADGLVGAAGGIMGGIGGFTGVIPTLWCSLRGFEKDLQRNIIQNFNLAALAATMAIYLFTGAVTKAMLPQFAVVALALLIPSLLGARLYIGLAEATFRRVVLILLTASGLAMIAAALPTVLRQIA
jgi:hypothetical protein